jgi:hypothetical protein
VLHDHLLDEVAQGRKDLGACGGVKVAARDGAANEIEDVVLEESVGRQRQPRFVLQRKARTGSTIELL